MAENMPSAEAYRPGDVIDTYSERRLKFSALMQRVEMYCLMDLESSRTNPSYIVDLATLTGACVVALGQEASGLWSNDDKLRVFIKPVIQ